MRAYCGTHNDTCSGGVCVGGLPEAAEADVRLGDVQAALEELGRIEVACPASSRATGCGREVEMLLVVRRRAERRGRLSFSIAHLSGPVGGREDQGDEHAAAVGEVMAGPGRAWRPARRPSTTSTESRSDGGP